MGENESGHRSCSEHIPIELWSSRTRRGKIDFGKIDFVGQPVLSGFRMVELGNSKDSTKTDCFDH